MRRVTIADVAAKAGVSKSTVSHALSDKRPISAPTKARIHQAIAELGYEPNRIAQQLAGASGVRNVGFALPLILPAIDGLEIKFIASAAQVISQCGLTFVLISDTERGARPLLRFIDNGVVDGLILMQVQLHDERVDMLRDRDIPFVLLGRCADNSGVAYVDSDIHDGMDRALMHLAELGHKHVLYMYQEDFAFGFAKRAIDSFHAVCIERELQPHSAPCELTAASGEAVFNRMLDANRHITAVIVWNDAATMGVLQAAHARDMSIPEDLSVICTNDTAISRLLAYQPTLIDIQPHILAETACDILIRRLEGRESGLPQVLVPPQFSIGHSTAPPPTS